MENKVYDLLIIGAGPAGISLAAEAEVAGVSQKNILILEKAPEHSWMIRSLYPDKKRVTANYKGIPAVCRGIICFSDRSKDETITFLDKAIRNSGVTVKYREEVRSIDRLGVENKPLFRVNGSREEYLGRTVAIAVGIFGKPNKPDYALPRELKSRIHFDITSFSAENERILVVGGGDSAGEYAQYLAQKGNTVEISYRRNTFSRMNVINRESVLTMLRRGRLTILWESNIDSVSESSEQRIRVRFREDTHGTRTYDRIVYALGGSTPENFLKSAGIDFHDKSPRLDRDGESMIPGLFVTGDLAAGKSGGSISTAFDSSRNTMSAICRNYLKCKMKTGNLPLS